MEQNNITFDSLYKENDCFLQNIILISKIMNQFWDYDSVTDEPLSSHMDSVCESLSENDFCSMNDYFEKIASFSQYAIKNIIRDIHTKIQRDHSLLPARQVKETDSRTMEWLATKPGRNIKEKLAGKNQILAPIRYSSCDTQENRIFKAFLTSLNNYFIYWKKSDIRNKHLDSLYYDVYRWLRSDDANSIHNLNNSVPNNTLLNDKNYRKIWKAWNNIQLLESMVRNDIKPDVLNSNIGLTLTYLAISELKKQGVFFYQQPLLPKKVNIYNFKPIQHSIITKNKNENILYFRGSYYFENKNLDNVIVEISLKKDGLFIKLMNKKILDIIYKADSFEKLIKNNRIDFLKSKLEDRIRNALKEICVGNPINFKDHTYNSSVIALDMTQEQSCFSYECNEKFSSNKLNSRLITQKWIWEDSNKTQIIPSPYLKIKENEETLFNITIKDLINNNTKFSSEDYLYSAHIFAKQLKNIFPKTNHFIYLVPDKVDDFSDNYLSVALDASFPNAVPVPRSIAKVFQWQNTKEFLNQRFIEGSFVRIIEHSDEGLLYVTDIKAKLPDDKNFQKLKENKIPQCITWERQPTEISKSIKDITKRNVIKAFDIDKETQLTDGALFYFIKQQNLIDIPLWNDHLLELSMMADNTSIPIPLVGPDTVVNARKGKKEKINVPQKDLIISAGKDSVEFRLIIGKDESSQKKYYALVEDSNLLPFKEDTTCELELYYSYGDLKPYTLFLKTLVDGIIKRIEVQWEKESHKDYIHVPGPEYINEMSWDEALSTKLRKSSPLDVRGFIARLNNTLQCINNIGWQNCIIDGVPKTKDNPNANFDKSNVFFLNLLDSNNNSVVCFKNDFAPGQKIEQGTNVSCLVVPSENFDNTPKYNKKGQLTLKALDIQVNNGIPNKSELSKYISPVIHLWNQGRTARNPDFPKDLYSSLQEILQNTMGIISNDTIPIAVRNEAAIILGAFHEDANIDFANYLNEILTNTLHKERDNQNTLYHRKRILDAISYAIGNVNHDWQKDLLSKTIELGSNKYSTEEHQMCIDILGRALWRTRNCILAITAADIEILLKISVENIENFIKESSKIILYLKKLISDDKENEISKNKLRDRLYDLWRLKFSYLKAIELVLALYRLRNHSSEIDNKCLQLLAPLPDNDIIQRLRNTFPLLEQFSNDDNFLNQNQEFRKIMEVNLPNQKYKKIKSRIDFEINDDNWNTAIPDYLYALEKYTQGEAGGIRVLGISEDAQE